MVEVVIAVAIMGLAVIAIAGAMGASVRHSSYTSARARVETEARRLAEWQRTAGQLAPCDNTDPSVFYESELAAKATPGFVVSNVSVEGYQSGGYTNIDGPCSSG